VYARVESLRAGSWTRFHEHAWVQLSYATSGVLGVRAAEASYVAPQQWAVWVPAGVRHEVTTTDRAEMRSLYLAPAAVAWAPPRVRVIEITPLARELIVAVTALPVEYDEAGAPGRLVAVLLDQLRAAREVGFSFAMPAEPRVAAVCAALQRDPGDRRTLAEWAREAGASERTLARLFRRETGLSFRSWRQRLRVVLALSALEAGASVTTVALDFGYDSTSAFIAAFKRLAGKTPSAVFLDEA
jgi:AraC-like DNA-binding protein